MHQIGYYLDEDAGLGLDLKDLQRAVDEARKVSAPRAIVIINPGNPTGQVLTRDNIELIIKFAHKENLFLFADEVYQVGLPIVFSQKANRQGTTKLLYPLKNKRTYNNKQTISKSYSFRATFTQKDENSTHSKKC